MTVIGLRESPHHGLNVVVKRVDGHRPRARSRSLLLAPMLAVDRVARSKLTSRGPIFYRQERCGLNGAVVPDAEVPHDAGGRRGGRPADDGRERPARTRLGASSARRTWTNCRSSSTCCGAT